MNPDKRDTKNFVWTCGSPYPVDCVSVPPETYAQACNTKILLNGEVLPYCFSFDYDTCGAGGIKIFARVGVDLSKWLGKKASLRIESEASVFGFPIDAKIYFDEEYGIEVEETTQLAKYILTFYRDEE